MTAAAIEPLVDEAGDSEEPLGVAIVTLCSQAKSYKEIGVGGFVQNSREHQTSIVGGILQHRARQDDAGPERSVLLLLYLGGADDVEVGGGSQVDLANQVL